MTATPRACPPESPQCEWPEPFVVEYERSSSLPPIPPLIPWPHQDENGNGRFWPWALRRLAFTMIGTTIGMVFWGLVDWLIRGQ